MTPALVIFDCDGVLVDSEAIANRLMADAINASGIPITYEDCRTRFIGGTLQRVIDTVEEWLGKPLPLCYSSIAILLRRRSCWISS